MAITNIRFNNCSIPSSHNDNDSYRDVQKEKPNIFSEAERKKLLEIHAHGASKNVFKDYRSNPDTFSFLQNTYDPPIFEFIVTTDDAGARSYELYTRGEGFISKSFESLVYEITQKIRALAKAAERSKATEPVPLLSFVPSA